VASAQIEHGKAAVETSLGRFIKAGKLDAAAGDSVQTRLKFTTDFGLAVGGVDVVVEAVIEHLEAKREVFKAAVESAKADALLATNTSQLSITRIAEGLGGASSRLIGMHFFNPPVMMKLVELIRGLDTSDETVELARAFAQGLGKEVVVCNKDTPGFITTRGYAALRLECIRMLDEDLATAEDIDKAFRLGFNFPMGPLELGDFNGLDSFTRVLDYLTESYGERFRPTPALRNLVAANRVGRKAGRGFYRYNATGERESG
jgi:3-hydroxybutyryl-CoA dehydrogenase